MGTFEANAATPALARVHRGFRRDVGVIFEVPTQTEMTRNNGLRGENFLDVEAKANAMFAESRHARHHADDLDVFAFPFHGQRIRQPILR